MQYIVAIVIAILLYHLQDGYYRRHWQDNLTVTIRFHTDYARIGDTVRLTETIENAKSLPLPVLYAKFRTDRSFLFDSRENAAVSDHYYRNDAFSVSGRQQITRELTFRVTERGYFTVDTVDLVTRNLFFTKTYAAVIANHASLYVYPAPVKAPDIERQLRAVLGDTLARHLFADPLSFRGIREYRPGDPMRLINWKVSAKTDSLNVNMFYDTIQTHVALYVNLDTQDYAKTHAFREYLISLAAALLSEMSANGNRIRLYLNAPDVLSDQPLSIPDGSGDMHLHTLLRGLSRVDSNSICEDFNDHLRALASEPADDTQYLILTDRARPELVQICDNLREHEHFVSILEVYDDAI